jgi:hypothetical protein
MEFRNLTPVEALAFTNVDTSGSEYHIVLIKAGYALRPMRERGDDIATHCSFSGRQLTHFPVLLEGEGDEEAGLPAAVALVLADAYVGDIGKTSVKAESDLVPYRPRCDVVIQGNSYAPSTQPLTHWTARIRLSVPPTRVTASAPEFEPLNPLMGLTEAQLHAQQDHALATQRKAAEPRILLDKQLQICGPRFFNRGATGWSITQPEPAASCALLWEHAFGGNCQVRNPDPQTVAEKPFLLNEACYTNPIGCGWYDKRWPDALKKADLRWPKQLPAPRIAYDLGPIHDVLVTLQPEITAPQGYEHRQMAEASRAYTVKPGGFGWVARTSVPRINYTGTHDASWQENRWPGLPEDFDFAYWNGAPADQQIEFPTPDFTLELLNFSKPNYPDAGIPSDAGTYLAAQMPGHRGLVLIRTKDGLMLPMPMTVDTIVFDTELMQVNIIWRVGILKSVDARVLEARLERDPKNPLLRIQDPNDKTREVVYG